MNYRKNFFHFAVIFLMFTVFIGSSGCGGGGGSSPSRSYAPPVTSDDVINPEIPITSPDVPVISPDVPQISQDIPVISPDIPVNPIISPDIPKTSPDVPVVSSDIPVISPDIPVNPITSPDIPETPGVRNYVVTFNSNGGSSISRQNVQPNGTVTMPENPTKENYIFAGWFKDENFTEMFLFGEDGDKITSNITLYARWIENNPDLFLVEYAIGEISIGFARGDNSNYITQDLTLPTKINSFYSVDVTWNSNSSAISSNGKVNRPTGNDENVTLTARVAAGNESKTREFNLKVIHVNGSVRTEIPESTSVDIKNMNLSNDDFSISYNGDNTQVTGIIGNFSDIPIKNDSDALDVIQSLHQILGIDDPYKELEHDGSNRDDYSSNYSFIQTHDNMRVFGRRIFISANSRDIANFLKSDLLSSSIIESSDLKSSISQEQAENIAKNYHGESFDVDVDNTEKIIYSLYDYETKPVIAYIVRVFGAKNDNEYLDENVFVNASNGSVIKSSSNANYLAPTIGSVVKASGENEFSKNVSFDVVYEPVKDAGLFQNDYLPYYFMRDPNLNIQVYNNFRLPLFGGDITLFARPVSSIINKWTDKHHVSVYSNMREILQWWQNRFGRNSLDNHGGKVYVIAHAWGKENNAAWQCATHQLYVYDNSKVSSYDHFPGSAVDVLTHETTHAVFGYEIGDFKVEKNIISAVNEAYADIFACVKDQDWSNGERLFNNDNAYQLHCIRNIAEPDDPGAYTRQNINPTTAYNFSQNNGFTGIDEHKLSLLISHAAYLMHKYMITDCNLSEEEAWRELGNLWYSTMRRNVYSETSIFLDVRELVIQKAKDIGKVKYLPIIKKAFDEVGIYANGGILSGTIVDSNGNPVLNAFITIKSPSGQTFTFTGVDDLGYFSVPLNATTYSIEIEESDFVSLTLTQTIGENQDVSLGNIVLTPKKNISGTVTDYNTGNVIENASVNVSNDNSNFSTATDENGYFSFNLEEGDYSLSISADDYITFNLNQVIENNKDVELDVELVKYGSALLSGTIYDSKTGSPISGVRLNIRSGWNVETGDTVAEMLTESNGTYSTPMVAGYYTVEMIKDGYETSTFNVTVSGTVTNQNGYLEPNGSGGNTAEDVPIDASHFPDENFRNYVKHFDTNNDGILSTGEIEKVTFIYVYNRAITDLTGVEFFTELQTLYCHYNQLTTLDVSGCTALQNLDCSYNQLTTLDVSKNPSLKYLNCSYNQLTTLYLHHTPRYFYRDDNVNIIIVNDANTAKTSTVTNAQEMLSYDDDFNEKIVAILPEVMSTENGVYDFEVSFDEVVRAGIKLFVRVNSEDVNNYAFYDENSQEISMPLEKDFYALTVSIQFGAEKKYSPVIIATSNSESSSENENNYSSSGGCNSIALGGLTLIAFVILLKKR